MPLGRAQQWWPLNHEILWALLAILQSISLYDQKKQLTSQDENFPLFEIFFFFFWNTSFKMLNINTDSPVFVISTSFFTWIALNIVVRLIVKDDGNKRRTDIIERLVSSIHGWSSHQPLFKSQSFLELPIQFIASFTLFHETLDSASYFSFFSHNLSSSHLFHFLSFFSVNFFSHIHWLLTQTLHSLVASLGSMFFTVNLLSQSLFDISKIVATEQTPFSHGDLYPHVILGITVGYFFYDSMFLKSTFSLWILSSDIHVL